MEKQEALKGGFDPLVVHVRDTKTNRIASANPFRVIVEKGTRFYEWPKSSGNLWYEDRMPAGRLEDNGTIVRGEDHKSWAAPVTEDQRVGIANETLKQENKKLMAELASIKQEQDMTLKHKTAEKVEVKVAKSAKVETKAK